MQAKQQKKHVSTIEMQQISQVFEKFLNAQRTKKFNL